MSSSLASTSLLDHSRRRPLAAGIAALFAISATSAWAAPPAVTNCLDDNSGGTLRQAVAGAASGDTVDMSSLTLSDPGCGGGVISQITLTTGAIVVGQGTLTIKGPGRDALLIKAAPNSRVIFDNYYNAGHPGHLYLEGLNVGYAYITNSHSANGGCIDSIAGTVTLTGVRVYHCSATTTAAMGSQYRALGGGVFAVYGLTIANSIIGHAEVHAMNLEVRARGGCAHTPGPLDIRNSIIANCKAVGPIGSTQVGGGALESHDNVTITGSLIASSYSSSNYGGVAITTDPGYGPFTTTISNSSIAYNKAHGRVGGVYSNAGHVDINNSTIVLNTAGQYTYTRPPKPNTYNAGVGVSIYSVSGAFSLQSTIIANNTIVSNDATNGMQEDLSFGASTGLTFAASNNLVRAYKTDVTLPSGQGNLAKGTCPLLGHGRDNGGGTYTAAPQSGSPLIDAGNNNANDPHTGVPALYDQRGPGYPRVSNGIADIGAHEVQKSDIVFNAEFETGCE